MQDALGHYKILEHVGSSGLGDVYRARDTQLGRTVAIKVLPASLTDDPRTRDRFLRDARMATALSHPNIAALYEVGEDHGQLFLACEFVPGESLKTTMAGHAMNPRRAIDFAVQVADALADAHAAGIVHGHLTADTIRVTSKGSAKLLDFGLSGWALSGGGTDALAKYRDDIAALGRVLFEMLTGAPPPTPPRAPSTLNRHVPGELDAIVLKALAPADTPGYQSAATLAAELRAVRAIIDVRTDAEAVVPPRARAGGPRLAAWTLAALALIGVAAWLAREPARRLWESAFRPPPAPVIGVLPLELETADRSETYFADGVAEGLARRLGAIPGVLVLGRSGLRRDRGRTPTDLARALGARVVLTGRIRPQASPLSMSLELIDPAGESIWSATYSRDPSQLLALQAQAAGEVASALGVDVEPTAAGARAEARVVDPAAYRAYLEGRQAAADGRLSDAVAFYQQAADRDAGLAEALAALALAIDTTEESPTDVQRRDDAATRAYQLDPDLPDANAAMALGAADLEKALGYLRHGVEVDRSWGDGYRRIADRIRPFDPVRAAAFYQASLAVDPRLAASRAGLSEAQGMQPPDDARLERERIATAVGGLIERPAEPGQR